MLTSKGTNVSGGQKQRILLARAFAANPEILILDDSSSALDYKTDARLRGEIRKHYQNTTTVIVAQRVSSIKHADHILVLEEGRVIGSGTHAELMKTCETYQRNQQNADGGRRGCVKTARGNKSRRLGCRSRRYKIRKKCCCAMWKYLYRHKWMLLFAFLLTVSSNLLALLGADAVRSCDRRDWYGGGRCTVSDGVLLLRAHGRVLCRIVGAFIWLIGADGQFEPENRLPDAQRHLR